MLSASSLLTALLAIVLSIFPQPHVFPDGHIERTLEAVIRGDTLLIEYSVGMSDATMQAVVDTWTQSAASEGNSEKHNDTSAKAPKLPATPIHRKQTFDNEAADNKTPNEATDAADENFKKDKQLLEKFQKLAAVHLQKRILVESDGKELKLVPVTDDTPTRRHMSVSLHWKVRLPEKRKFNMTIMDNNFPKLDGNIRLAIKATGKAMLARSNVAPIIVRAERVSLGELNHSASQSARTIECTLIQPQFDPSVLEE